MRAFLTGFLLSALLGCSPTTPARPPQIIEEAVVYPAGSDSLRGVLCHPAGPGPYPAVVVVHEDFGLTDSVKTRARELAQQGFVTLAVDLYRGEVVSDLLDAHIMDRGLAEERVLADLQAAVNYLRTRRDVKADAVGAIGWGSGGGYALAAAVHDPRLRAVVVCYGRLAADPAPLAPLQAAVLGIFAGKDEGISADTIEQFRQAMRKANKRLAGVHVYPDSPHGFMNTLDGGDANRDAWRKIEAFFREELRD